MPTRLPPIIPPPPPSFPSFYVPPWSRRKHQDFNNVGNPQAPVGLQLIVAMKRLGFCGNAASECRTVNGPQGRDLARCGGEEGDHGEFFPLFQKPHLDGVDYYCQMGYYAMNSMVVCDDRKRIRFLYTGWRGCAHKS
ncbi:hypothetical protein BDK51DRAFT_41199 [Blyttiomyces helicus]|uniref:Uncharacterized protein n=1 Tax=Blyttiomyces helicus TaxID=388810 RepID=A0A4P9WIL6_9FUNG|nr:hypothetical protein BDK51DRAFT_41199 [Blyttiomyces helicus]|eukprot:RKO91855.1 hypothetical protein BDK51DRAFT_41199 [Blyttiomyces helicus]